MLDGYDKDRIKDITEIIKSEGYEIGNFEGIILSSIKEACIGILLPRKLEVMNLNIPLKAAYIANLWFNDNQSLEEYSHIWNLNIYGRENYTKLDKILSKLQNIYYVQVIKNLETEKPEKEFDDGLIL